MDGCSTDVFFQINNVHSEDDLSLKADGGVTFIYDEYEKEAGCPS